MKADKDAFIFSLVNKDNKPVKIKPHDTDKSIYCLPGCGPLFGSNDFFIADKSNITNVSKSQLGKVYIHSQYINDSNSFLADAPTFTVSDIEVYTRTNH